MNKEPPRETTRKTYSGVITRSKRKSSLKIEDMDKTEDQEIPQEKIEQISDLNELSNVQELFSNFIEALNADVEISRKTSKRKNRKQILIKRENDNNKNESNLKRVKKETRKSRRLSKRTTDLETIAEDVSKENAVNQEKKKQNSGR